MFGFKKKHCSICQSKPVINVGKPLGYLCEKHMLETYRAKFIGHSGRKIIIPPTSPDKYVSYQFETISSLKSYGLTAEDVALAEELFSNLSPSECCVMQSQYETRDCLDLEVFGTSNWKPKSAADAVVFVLSALPKYMNSSGISLPPAGNEDIILYPLKS